MKKNKLYLLGFCLAALLIAASYYIQFFLNIKPCLLCFLQRWVLVLIGILFLMSFLIHRALPRTTLVLNFLTVLFNLLGLFAAGRQIWLEHQPQNMNMSCLPDINYLITHLPLQTVFKMLVLGSSDCGQVNFTFLGLSLAGWSLIGFIICLGVVLTSMKKN